MLYREQPRLQRNYLQVVKFTDPRFDDRHIQLGAWQPLSFMREVGYGLYLLAPWDPAKEPIILVHGINASPVTGRRWPRASTLRASSWCCSTIPAGCPCATAPTCSASPCATCSCAWHPGGCTCSPTAWGLVARRALQFLDENEARRLCLFATLSTPWDGHPSAATGVQRVPFEVPVWRDMAPAATCGRCSPGRCRRIRQWMLVSYGGNRRLLPEPNDGVVPLASELRSAAQDEAGRLYLVDESHTGILHSRRATALLERALRELPEQGCAD